MRLLAVVAVAALALGGATASPARDAGPKAASGRFHVVFTSDRDGDADVYAADEHGRRLVALTRNAVDDRLLVAPGSGALLVLHGADEAVAEASLLSPDGRSERKLGRVKAGDAVFSGAGRNLALGRVDERGRDERILLVPVAGGAPRDLGPGRPRAFSHDGRYLAFATQDGSRAGIVELATGEQRVFAVRVSPDVTPFWSPNLTRFAYLPLRGGGQVLVVVGARPSVPREIVLDAGGGSDFWQPDAPLTWLDEHRLLIGRTTVGQERTGELLVVDVDRRRRAPVTPWGGKSSAIVSPGRDAVAYVVGNRAIGVTRLDGTATRTQAMPGRVWGPLAWSPRGDAIAALVGPPRWPAAGGRQEVDVLRLTPRWTLRRVASGLGPQPPAPYALWTPDGSALAVRIGVDVAVGRSSGGRAQPAVGAGHAPPTVAWVPGPIPASAVRAEPLPPSETGGTQLRTRGKVAEIAASGPWVAAIVGATATDCEHVVAWRAGSRSVRLGLDRQLPCSSADPGAESALERLELTGTRVTWRAQCAGASCQVRADLRRPGVLAAGPAQRAPSRRPSHEGRGGLTMSLRNGSLVVKGSGRHARTTVQAPGLIVGAELVDAGLFYAWNDARGGAVAFIPTGDLQARVASSTP